jgi:hypothetical protein
MRLHSVNTLRVAMEFCVVHYHLAGHFGPNCQTGILSSTTISEDFICFFFVLSGFVTMHSNRDTDFTLPGARRAYVVRKLTTAYPVYLAWFLVDLPGTLLHTHCAPALVGLVLISQPLLLHSWLGVQHIATANIVGWYLCTLFWLWFLFPFLSHKALLSHRPWLRIGGLYAASVLLWAVLLDQFRFDPFYARAVPLFRLPEFLMGCATAYTLDRPLFGGDWAMVLPVLCFVVYCGATFSPEGRLWRRDDTLFDQCVLWPLRPSDAALNPSLFVGKTAPFWCLVLHYLAVREQAGAPRLPVVWDALDASSFHVYISHYTVSYALLSASRLLGLFEWWSLDTLMLACYFVGHLSATWVVMAKPTPPDDQTRLLTPPPQDA